MSDHEPIGTDTLDPPVEPEDELPRRPRRRTVTPVVTRTAVSQPRAIHPGDTVIVEGTTSSNGSVTASRILVTASNATAGRRALGGTPTTPGDPSP
jgi:hypothetical protein